jgi:hypothetical protein
MNTNTYPLCLKRAHAHPSRQYPKPLSPSRPTTSRASHGAHHSTVSAHPAEPCSAPPQHPHCRHQLRRKRQTQPLLPPQRSNPISPWIDGGASGGAWRVLARGCRGGRTARSGRMGVTRRASTRSGTTMTMTMRSSA